MKSLLLFIPTLCFGKGIFYAAQSHLDGIKDKITFSANFEGASRIFVTESDQGIKPAFVVPDGLKDHDFLSPYFLGENHLIISGKKNDSKNFDVFLADLSKSTVQNVTDSPNADEGYLCVDQKRKWFSYAAPDGQKVVVFQSGSVKVQLSFPLNFLKCRFTPDHLYGISHGNLIQRCPLKGGPCEAFPGEKLLESVDLFHHEQSIGVLGMRAQDQFRIPLVLDKDFKSFKQLPVKAAGDVLDYVDSSVQRVGFQSKYFLSTDPKNDVVIFKLRKFNGKLYAMIGTKEYSRIPAVMKKGSWVPLKGVTDQLQTVKSEPQFMVWILTPQRRLIQAAYSGPLRPTKVVLWLHGGPKENVSLRFNPYYQRLNEMGIGVIALNYPGSTGRGQKFEDSFQDEFIHDALAGTMDYLAMNSVTYVIPWGVSTGSKLLRYFADKKFPFSGLVDQAGFGNKDMVEKVKNDPYFSIRGEYDDWDRSVKINFLYKGGHDITDPSQFEALFSSLKGFMSTLKPMPQKTINVETVEMILDAGHDGNSSDPNVIEGVHEAELTFELMYHLASGCLKDKKLFFTRHGNPTFFVGDEGLRIRQNIFNTWNLKPMASLHFNARPKGYPPENTSSVFIPKSYSAKNLAVAKEILNSLVKFGVPAKNEYKENAAIVRLEKGIFGRTTAVLPYETKAPFFLIESSYYDDKKEFERFKETYYTDDGLKLRTRLRKLSEALCEPLKKAL